MLVLINDHNTDLYDYVGITFIPFTNLHKIFIYGNEFCMLSFIVLFHDMVDSHETAPFNIFFIMMHMKCMCAY